MNQELDLKLKEVDRSGKFLITVTYVDGNNELQHYWVTQTFPKGDILPSMDHIRSDIETKEVQKAGKWQ